MACFCGIWIFSVFLSNGIISYFGKSLRLCWCSSFVDQTPKQAKVKRNPGKIFGQTPEGNIDQEK
jgi:hypothetical protein